MENKSILFKLFLVCLLILATFSLKGQVSNPIADQAFDAFNSSFLLQSPTLTFYREAINKNTKDYFWMQALDIQTAQDAYSRTRSLVHKTLISNLLTTFNKQNSGSGGLGDWTWNEYNDDLLWAVLAYLRGYEYTGNVKFLDVAKYGFNLTYNHTGKGNWGWDMTNGGIWWRKAMDMKSPLSNSPAVISACYLYEFTGEKDYLDKAKSIYQWTRDNLYNENTGEVWGEIFPNGTVNKSACVFNNGGFAGAANYLYQLTGEKKYFDDAKKTFDRVITNMTSSGILAAGTRGGTDLAEYIRYLGDFVRQNHLWNEYYFFMKRSADAAWSVRRTDLNIAWNDWTKKMPIDEIASVIECNSSVVMQEVTPVLQTFSDTIEAENFNFTNGVEIQSNSKVSHGKNAGSITEGDWLEYIVNVETSGTYTISYYVSGTIEGAVSILENGQTMATTSLPNTGSLDTYEEVYETVKLSAGIQSIKLLANKGGWNIDKWSAKLENPSLPGTIQAEKYTRMSGVQKETTKDLGGGQDVGYIETGDWMEYSLNIPVTGIYTLCFRIAGTSVGSLALKLGEETLATTSLLNTGDWQNWSTVTTTAHLIAGTQSFRIYAVTGGFNINWWSAVEGVPTRIQKTSFVKDIRFYTNPVNTQLTIDCGEQVVLNATIFDSLGRKVYKSTSNTGNNKIIDIENLAKGIYILSIQTDKNSRVVYKFRK